MKQGCLFFLATVCLFCFGANAYADPVYNSFGTNITIWDKWGTPPTSGPGEDNEVEPPDFNEQSWDLEGFFLSGNVLTLIGGFDFKNGQQDPYRPQNTYTSGDIFIGTNIGAVKYGSDITNSYGSYATINNIFGYNYAIRLNFGTTNTFSVYQIDSGDLVKTPYFTENSDSSPWMYVSGGTLIANGNMLYQTGLTNTGFLGDSHNAISIDLSTFLPNNTDFIAHFDMGCGNDMLVGQGATIPEPGTLMLLGSGLIAIMVLRKKIGIR